jgi:guanine deaminase
MMTPQQLMALAVEKARAGVVAGQSPFGCAIAVGDEVLAVCHNTVVSTTDITAHAEVNALRLACRQAGTILLENCVVATTCEPCPMCMAALHWARVREVFYGATIADTSAAGFNELTIAAADVLTVGGSSVKLTSGILRDECRTLFDEWLAQPDRVLY